MLAIVQSLETWSNLLQGVKKVLCNCDNSAVVYVIQKGSSKDKDLMEPVLKIFVPKIFEFEFIAIHIPGVKNKIADSLSRGQIKHFRSLTPVADDTMTLMGGL